MPRQPTHHRTPLFSRPIVVVAATTWLASTAFAQQPAGEPPTGEPAAPAQASPVSEPAPSQAPASTTEAPLAPQPESTPKAEGKESTATNPESEEDAAAQQPSAAAETSSATDYAYIPVHAERRSGFMFGLLFAPTLSFAEGSPIKVNKRDQKTDTGASVGTAFTLFIGGAFTDWFTFKIGLSSMSTTAGELKTTGTGVVFGVETWPLFYRRGGIFRDLGLGVDFGTGASRVFKKDDDKNTLADGAGYAMIRGNVFWDALRLGPVNLGPTASYEYKWKDTYTEHSALIGLRAVFYGGP